MLLFLRPEASAVFRLVKSSEDRPRSSQFMAKCHFARGFKSQGAGGELFSFGLKPWFSARVPGTPSLYRSGLTSCSQKEVSNKQGTVIKDVRFPEPVSQARLMIGPDRASMR